MKKGLICILSLMMVLGLGACSSNDGKTTEPENSGSDKTALVTEITSPISIEFWHNCTNIQELSLIHILKGKGVSFMENKANWHGVAPKPEEAEAAIQELEAQING